jgi:hypothetical protein
VARFVPLRPAHLASYDSVVFENVHIVAATDGHVGQEGPRASARSEMAEAILRRLSRGRIEVFSAGSQTVVQRRVDRQRSSAYSCQ